MGEDVAVLVALGVLFFGVPFLVSVAIDLCGACVERKHRRAPVAPSKHDPPKGTSDG